MKKLLLLAIFLSINIFGQSVPLNNDLQTVGGLGLDGDGNYRLGGRRALNKEKITQNCEESGIVIVYVEVDTLGNVIKAVPGYEGSTTNADCLNEPSKEAALATKFNADSRAPIKQSGLIFYRYKLSEESFQQKGSEKEQNVSKKGKDPEYSLEISALEKKFASELREQFSYEKMGQFQKRFPSSEFLPSLEKLYNHIRINSDWEADNLKGKVKKNIERTYYQTEKFGEKVYELRETITKEYNKLGYVGGIFPSVVENGRYSEYYTYDDNMNLIESKLYNGQRLLEIRRMEYNEDGLKTAIKKYDADGNLQAQWTFQYSGQNKNNVKFYKKSYSKLYLEDELNYYYNKLGDVTVRVENHYPFGKESKETSSNRVKVIETTYSRNKKGDVIEKVEESDWDKKTFSYSYDKNNNWIECIESRGDGVVKKITRDIFYY